ncbi:hypothetical protein [Streptomyces gardneri]|uniref:Uncharacterized protein n=1 Tax=Streptomyces gardneri TaxID=66892 RepID=A0A4Y3RUT6_9ACTN|nr:hypothetical protein [Streptomyces gardneri]GEB61322.1 hypothetical protein SGA01_69270 [Streptomyces gardneri]GHH04488.1 hypothetical protein GCM10017674_42760 [Streptomyces gardneri]
MRKLATAVVAAGLFFGGMGVAVADSEHTFVMTDPGVAFVGTYQWQPASKVPSGLHMKGELRDTSHGDGHNVYLRTRVEGYPWGRIKGVQRKNVKVDEVFFDGAVLKTKEVRLQVCRDRGSLRPDNCSPERLFSRR